MHVLHLKSFKVLLAALISQYWVKLVQREKDYYRN